MKVNTTRQGAQASGIVNLEITHKVISAHETGVKVSITYVNLSGVLVTREGVVYAFQREELFMYGANCSNQNLKIILRLSHHRESLNLYTKPMREITFTIYNPDTGEITETQNTTNTHICNACGGTGENPDSIYDDDRICRHCQGADLVKD